MPSPARVRPYGLWRRLFWLAVFGIAFGYLEGAVVIYLRELYYPSGFRFPLAPMSERVLWVELGRELATLVMLLSVARLAARTGWGRFGAFSLLFGVWDLVYYLALYAVLGWPESLLTWDILFLLPLIWAGPVLSAALVAACLCVAGAVIFLRAEAGRVPRTAWWVWAGALASLALLLYSYMANHGAVVAGRTAELSFPWFPYAVGVVLGCVLFAAAFLRDGADAGTKPAPAGRGADTGASGL